MGREAAAEVTGRGTSGAGAGALGGLQERREGVMEEGPRVAWMAEAAAAEAVREGTVEGWLAEAAAGAAGF